MLPAEDQVLRIRTENLSWRKVDSEVVVLDLKANSYLSINESGIPLWELLTEGTTLAEMTARLVSDFTVDYDRARGDVENFVELLTARNLLDGVSG